MEKLKQLRQFLVEVWAELKKTTWPSQKEVFGTTMVVIATVVVSAFFLWIVDMILNKGMAALFRVGGR